MKKLIIFLLGAGVLVGGYFFLTSEDAPEYAAPINTPMGEIQGVKTDDAGITNFMGIPYAQAPVGQLRWQPPVAAEPWQGLFTADSFGSRCMQQSGNSGRGGFVERMIRGLGLSSFKTELALTVIRNTPASPVAEDCLYLNVRTPKAGEPNAKLPVMVWIHGGGHQTGSGSDDLYQSNALVKEGVVLVTINYRLGIFGYLAHPSLSAESAHDASGNYGLLDQMQALEWVRGNISAFGGDPENVTIFGESAGAWGVTELMASPLAQGLFHKAIAESGATSTLHFLRGTPVSPKSGEGEGMKITAALGLGENAVAAEMRDVPAEKLQNFIEENGQFSGILHPIVEGWSIPRPAPNIFADGEEAAVPLLIGGNSDEGTLFYHYYNAPNTWGGEAPRDADGFKSWMATHYGDASDRLISLYGLDDTEGRLRAEMTMLGDDLFISHIRRTAEAHARAGNPTYLYHFTRVPPDEEQTIGAFHAAELFFVFDKFNTAIYAEDADAELRRHVNQYWTNFAKTGNPNGAGLTDWPQYQRTNEKWMVLDRTPQATSVKEAERLDLVEARMLQAMNEARTFAISQKAQAPLAGHQPEAVPAGQ